MVTILALGAALSYGVADFLGGAGARRIGALRMLLLSLPLGLLTLLLAALAAGGGATPQGLAWGAAAGLAGGLGFITFYRALAIGPMSVIAPVSALTSAVLPVAVGTLDGERLNAGVLAGVVLCVVAIGLVSMEGPGEEASPRAAGGFVMALLSGAGFGVFFVLLERAGDDTGLWPLVTARSAGFAAVLLAVLAIRLGGRRLGGGPVTGGVLLLALGAGVLDATANALYFVAVHAGMLSLAAVLTSLYPAVTVLLARVVFSERLRAVQRIGLAVAAAGVALVTAG
ncbi:hypothetical protein DPM19_13515 [Actinomadura craniellae]|uniref:EamA domain-containing protein n=1 Tax=Actinomadura craniellae TaxID=2231787 RepID=A0A365H6Z7_9ACTN|nr:EamA family transporter [Actinomadura craniellae]RAY14756.1 hypothetical protein DPM19_13515 [Actinomadura craniellae]